MDLKEKQRLARIKWAEADREASLLEEMKKSIFATIYNQSRSDESLSQKDCEMQAFASTQYIQHIRDMVNARQESHKAYAELEYVKEELKEIERNAIEKAVELKYLKIGDSNA